ncbi:hypothetical protein NN561_007906 [Cricetulus griseus]
MNSVAHQQNPGAEGDRGWSRGRRGDQGTALLELRRPSPPSPPRTASGRVPAPQPQAWPTAGRRGRWPGASAGSREASGARRGTRALTSGSGAAGPRPRRPGSRRAAQGLRRAARRTDFAASPAPDSCHVMRGWSSAASARPEPGGKAELAGL